MDGLAPGSFADEETKASEKPAPRPEMQDPDAKATDAGQAKPAKEAKESTHDAHATAAGSQGVRSVLDADVTDASGKKVGEVRDVVIDLASSSVTHVVVDYEGSAFTDGGKVMISWTTANVGGSPDEATVILSTAQLDMAESFDEEGWRERTGDHQILVSEVMGDDVVRAGEEVGRVPRSPRRRRRRARVSRARGRRRGGGRRRRVGRSRLRGRGRRGRGRAGPPGVVDGEGPPRPGPGGADR